MSNLPDACFNEAGVVHAGEDQTTDGALGRGLASTRPALFTPERYPWSAVREPTIEASTRPALFTPERLENGANRSGYSGFNEAGVVHAGEDDESAKALGAPHRFNEAGVVHAGEGVEAWRYDGGWTWLQRGRRCSRRRGPRRAGETFPGCWLQRGRRCSRRRGHADEALAGLFAKASTRPALFTPERRRRSLLAVFLLAASTRPALFTPERVRRADGDGRGDAGFNEAGVVHAGEEEGQAAQGMGVSASTRPALFTPERSSPKLSRSKVSRLQRGRRCSRRRGGDAHAGLVASATLQRGRRCSRRRGRIDPIPYSAAHPLQRGRRCSRRRGARAVHQWV